MEGSGGGPADRETPVGDPVKPTGLFCGRGRLVDDLTLLLAQQPGARVVLERLTSMPRHGTSAADLWHAAEQARHHARLEGVGAALPDGRCPQGRQPRPGWGPVITLGEGVITGLIATGVYDGIERAIRRTREAYGEDVRAHLDIEELTEATAEGVLRVRTVTLSGDPKTVLDGLEKILGNDVHEGGPGASGASGSSGGALT